MSNNGFSDLNEYELLDVDGGFIFTTGAIIGLCLFGAGVAIGIGWALSE